MVTLWWRSRCREGRVTIEDDGFDGAASPEWTSRKRGASVLHIAALLGRRISLLVMVASVGDGIRSIRRASRPNRIVVGQASHRSVS